MTATADDCIVLCNAVESEPAPSILALGVTDIRLVIFRGDSNEALVLQS